MYILSFIGFWCNILLSLWLLNKGYAHICFYKIHKIIRRKRAHLLVHWKWGTPDYDVAAVGRHALPFLSPIFPNNNRAGGFCCGGIYTHLLSLHCTSYGFTNRVKSRENSKSQTLIALQVSTHRYYVAFGLGLSPPRFSWSCAPGPAVLL